MSNSALEAVIREHCRELKLGAVVREYPALCRRAQDGGRPYEEFLHELLEAEVTSRRQSTARRLLREARLPDVKTLDQVDWQALKGVAKPKILELASCQFITNAESVIVAGPIGTGKTMLAIALGVEATRRRFRVLFVRAADLVQSLLEARDERTLTRLQQRYEKVALLVVDELTLCRLSARAVSCSSTCSRNATSGAPLSSPPTWLSVSGSRFSVTRSSPRRCSIALPTIAIS